MIWTDVVQMFVYIAGALVVFAALLAPDSGRLGRGDATVGSAGQVRVFDFSTRSAPRLHLLGWPASAASRSTLATHGTDQFLVQRLLSAQSSQATRRVGLMLSGFIVFAQFVAVSHHRRDAVHLLPAHAAARARWRATTRSCHCSSSPRSRTARQDSSSRRSSPPRCRRRSTRSRRPR